MRYCSGQEVNRNAAENGAKVSVSRNCPEGIVVVVVGCTGDAKRRGMKSRRARRCAMLFSLVDGGHNGIQTEYHWCPLKLVGSSALGKFQTGKPLVPS